MAVKIPIVVVAYNRPKALERLLGSLLKASFPGEVELIISVDGEAVRREDGKTLGREDFRTAGREDFRTVGQGEEVRRVAREFVWPFGEKKLIFHEENLGLRRHVISCGDLSKDYDGVIVLEDDLYVAPSFYNYTLQAFDFYKDDKDVAGISLYSHAYNETAQFPFRPLADDSDVFFLQYAPSLGQFWSREGWSEFSRWYSTLDESRGSSEDKPSDKLTKLPPNIRLWPETSWKKYFIAYIIEKDQYFVYPRYSFTTLFNDEGTHMRVRENLFQVPLWLEKKSSLFKSFKESNAVYDVYGEMESGRLKRLIPSLQNIDFEADLYGMKSKGDTEAPLFLSSRKCKKAIRTFGREMKPHEMNIMAEVPGKYFSLGKKEDFEEPIYFVRLLKCHEKKELAYWYPIREYHFHKERLLTTDDSAKFYLNPGFSWKKFRVMLGYTIKYFRK